MMHYEQHMKHRHNECMHVHVVVTDWHLIAFPGVVTCKTEVIVTIPASNNTHIHEIE